MRHLAATALAALVAIAPLAGCGDDSSGKGGNGGTGGGSASTGTGTGSTTGQGGAGGQGTGGRGGSGGGGAGPCTVDECSCCLENGGVCGDRCSMTQAPTTYACEYPEAPAENQFLCDGWLPCTRDQICRFEDIFPEGCTEHACEAPPPECVDDLTCTCLEAALGLGPGACTVQDDGGLRVTR